ncbi:MAG: tRNA preQ1(34) S-adenosylmethionine ribosyltransferase-isomerase QueA [candidate division Zixibacteria bacterium]|nr:tRNA preQ1(34) S-adenosylmethionine ribosyltransferase-isomerase QueA [candidate division Zixibacteria bacterium]
MEKITYNLPQSLVAQFPAEQRDQCKLLYLKRASGELEEHVFTDIVHLLTDKHLLILNDTKVQKARLYGVGSQSGRRCEIFLVDKLTDQEWICLVRPGKKAKAGHRFYFSAREFCEVKEILADGSRRVLFSGATAEELMEKYGHMPLPPYIGRDDVALDRQMYQTVYAREGFSIAAPTAGLHFSEELFKKLEKKGVQTCSIRLDIGRGTFKMIESKHYEKHKMDMEEYWISEEAAAAVNTARSDGSKVVAVGTSAARALEGCFRKHGEIVAGHDDTDLFIFPGYEFKVVDAMITNFHLPASSLLAMLAAFAGKEAILSAYEFAIENKYRFYSYGDAMFVE